MTTDPHHHVLRLRKKHAPGSHERPQAADGARLVQAQSLRNAIIASVTVTILFAAVWAMLSVMLGRVFPWMTLVAGYLIGQTVRRTGNGIDWRFPTVAALFSVVAAVTGNVVVAASFTAIEFETGVLTILRNVTTYTWPVFFERVMTAADFIYAMFAAGIAAYFANRRLTRRQFQALRMWREQNDDG